MKIRRFLLSVLLLGSISFGVDARRSRIIPTTLSCEQVVEPVLIDGSDPRFSWINQPTDTLLRGVVQTAYQIRVVRDPIANESKEVLVWNSGKVKSSNSLYIPYEGQELVSAADYRWQVRVWDQYKGVSSWSKPAQFTTGYLTADRWKAVWIGAPWQSDAPRLSSTDSTPAAPLLRKTFRLQKSVRSAKIFISGLGYFELYLNGKRVGEDCLVPGQTDYGVRPGLDKGAIPNFGVTAHRVFYLCYDLTQMVREGENRVGAILGNGFYNTRVHYWTKPYGAPRLLAQIEVIYADGTSEQIGTDETWEARPSAIRADGVFVGEVYDARFETPQWCDPAEEQSDWIPVRRRRAPEGVLQAQTAPTDRVMERLAPISIEPLSDGGYELDFGEEISGWLRLQGIRAQAGDTVRMEYVCESPLGENLYVCKGGGSESYAARFTWFVFRKVRVYGLRERPLSEQFTAEAVYTNVSVNAEFSCSNALFNQIHTIWRRSQTDNMHGAIVSDCPHRERSAYLGDGQSACATVLHNYDAGAFYSKWIDDIIAAQDPQSGYIPNGAPPQPSMGGGVAWGAAISLIPWEYYLRYADKEALVRAYPAMLAQLKHMSRYQTSQGTLLSKAPYGQESIYWMNLGEWVSPYQFPTDEAVHTFYYWRTVDFTARVARTLGEVALSDSLFEKAREIQEAYHRRFYTLLPQGKASYGFGNNLFALEMGAVPDSCKSKIVEAWLSEMEEGDRGITTGMFGTRFLFERLTHEGYHEKAYALMNRQTFPSYGYWIAQGATTMWEEWNGEHSHNHPMLGASLIWFYRQVAGMNIDESSPGYKHIIIRPEPPEELKWAAYHTQTPYGKASVAWRKPAATQFEVEVLIPVGSTATIYLPRGDYRENNQAISSVKGVKQLPDAGDRSVFTVVSGSYRFTGTAVVEL